MGNQAVQKQIISQVLEESERITCLNKTESAWNETNLFGTKEEGPLVVKQLLKVKSEEKFARLEAQMGHITSKIEPERRHPNVMTYYKQSPVMLNQGGGKDVTLLLRQYVCFNLSEKLIHIPQLLTPIEKKWLIFQLLCSLEQIHSVPGLTHGDIKPDNILVTSYDWLYLADLHPYKPVVVMDDNLKRYNKYFGYLDNNIRCYLAPERWLTQPQSLAQDTTQMAPSMDIFSAGCVIAEILSDGLPLFDLPRLQAYRRGALDLREELAKRVEEPTTIELLLKMLAREPLERPSAKQCLEEWGAKVFPDSFASVFLHVGAAFQRLAYLYSDNRIALIRFNIEAIFQKCFNIPNAIVSQKFTEPMEPSMFRLCSEDKTIARFQDLVPSEFNFLGEVPKPEDMKEDELPTEEERKSDARDSALVVVHWIGQLYPTCFYPQMRLVALEMLEKISAFLPFETRLGQVLPYVARIFDTIQSETNTGQVQARVRSKAFEVLLSLFDDLVMRTDTIIIEPFDFKVFQNYVLPIVKKLMDQSRGEPLIRYTLAKNLARLARVGTRLIEVAQGSAIRLRQEVRDKRAQMRREGIRDSMDPAAFAAAGRQGGPQGAPWQHDTGNVQHSFVMMQRRTMVQNRVASTAEGLINAAQTHQQDAVLEDIVVPNFDSELGGLWGEIQRFIESFSGEEHDSNALIAMLANLTELSQIFGAEKGDFLIQQCISPINRSDYQVKVQVLKTLSSLCLRIGQQKVAANVLPLTESVLQDPEDLVVIQTIKMLIQFVKLRLMNKAQSLKTLEQLLPLLLYPNKQIRTQVATFISVIKQGVPPSSSSSAPEESKTEPVFVVNRKPFFTAEEFYCFVRPKLLIYCADQSDEMLDICSARDVLAKLRRPLSLPTMRSYFKQLEAGESVDAAAEREGAFSKKYDMSDEDTFAFAFLSEYFKERLRKLHTFQKQQTAAMALKSRKQQLASLEDPFAQEKKSRQGKLYRCLKASAVAHLTKIDLLDQVKKAVRSKGSEVGLSKDQKAQFVRQFQDNVTHFFDPQTSIQADRYHAENFGLNKPSPAGSAAALSDFITPEMQKVLTALNEVPLTRHSDTLNYLQSMTKFGQSGITSGIHINCELSLTAMAAQPSLVAHFESSDKQSFVLTEEHQREFKQSKVAPVQNVRPQGLLVTTLYEHRNPVNSVAVTDDQKYFLTAAREDKTVHVWKVQNIEEDVTSRSAHSLSTGASFINQVVAINRTKSVAVAGSGGIQIHDLERQMQGISSAQVDPAGSPRSSRRCALEESVTKIDLREPHDEVTRCLNVLTPNSNGSHLICAATQRGGFFMHDLRAKSHVFYDEGLFGCQRGAVTSMVLGSDPYQLTMGTLGGYVMVFDIRYSCISAMFHHNMHLPVMALATYKKGDDRGSPLALVSAGGPQHELSALNLETGLVETLFRCAVPSSDRNLSKSDCPIVPEYVRESTFRDNKFGTVRRETTLKQLSRQLHGVRNHEVFADMQAALQGKLVRNVDAQLMDVSTRQRFKLLHDACKSPNACRSILVPRMQLQRIMQDSQTAQYAITGGNDMKLRYWNLSDATKLSFQVNTPRDDEVSYMSEQIKDTTVIQERQLANKEVQPLNATKLGDQTSASQSGYYQRQGANQFVRFAENTAYHNSIAQGWNKQVMADQQNRLSVASPETQSLMKRFQLERTEGNSITVQGINGLSAGQLVNNLGILTNGQDHSLGGAGALGKSRSGSVNTHAAGQGQVDLVTEQSTRNSEIVAHSDTILDLALVDYKQQDAQQTPLLISCSRDSTVKVWRC